MAAARSRSRPKTRPSERGVMGGSSAPRSMAKNRSQAPHQISRDGARDPPARCNSFLLSVPHHFAIPGAPIDAGEILFQAATEQRPVRNINEELRDKPYPFFRCHPIAPIEPGQVHRLGITPQGAFSAQVEVSVKITQRQLAERA